MISNMLPQLDNNKGFMAPVYLLHIALFLLALVIVVVIVRYIWPGLSLLWAVVIVFMGGIILPNIVIWCSVLYRMNRKKRRETATE